MPRRWRWLGSRCRTRCGLPGSAAARLPVIGAMLDAARSCGDRDLVAEAHLLRAAALIELGDPAGRSAASRLHGDGRRTRARPRPVGSADPAGHVRPDRRPGDRSGEAGHRRPTSSAWPSASPMPSDVSAAFGGPLSRSVAPRCRSSELGGEMAMGMDSADPLWPMFPMFEAWAPAVRGDVAAATAALGDFSVLDIPTRARPGGAGGCGSRVRRRGFAGADGPGPTTSSPHSPDPT